MFWTIVVFGGFFVCLILIALNGVASIMQAKESSNWWQKFKLGAVGVFFLGYVIYCAIKLIT